MQDGGLTRGNLPLCSQHCCLCHRHARVHADGHLVNGNVRRTTTSTIRVRALRIAMGYVRARKARPIWPLQPGSWRHEDPEIGPATALPLRPHKRPHHLRGTRMQSRHAHGSECARTVWSTPAEAKCPAGVDGHGYEGRYAIIRGGRARSNVGSKR